MKLKQCPYCGGTNFQKIEGDYSILKMDENTWTEAGTISINALMLPISIHVCTSCDQLAISYNHEVVKRQI